MQYRRISCPVCKAKTDASVLPETRADYLPIWCKRCRQISIVSVELGRVKTVWHEKKPAL